MLVLDRRARARIAHAVQRMARCVYCERVGDVRRALESAVARRARISAVILEPRDADRLPTSPLVAQLRDLAPAVPVLALCPASADASPDILAAARAGVSGILLQGHDDVGAALRSAIESAGDDCAARLVVRELRDLLRGTSRGLVEYCMQHSRSALSVAGVAQALGVHRKTLVNRVAAAGLPEPRLLITWCRLCLVAHALEDPMRSVEQIAAELDFPSATALRNLCKRHTGLRATEIRERGGLAYVLPLFRRRLLAAQGNDDSAQECA
jgi:AraC-like DNA-binding protein